jgi:hypothetical protein
MRAVRLEQLRQGVPKGLDSGPSDVWVPEAMKHEARARRTAAKGAAKANRRGGPSPATGRMLLRGDLGSARR